MRKTLLGSTAVATASLLLAGAASAEEPIKLGIGGYMNNYFSFGDVDDQDLFSPGSEFTDYNETGLFSDGEITFYGETTLDNGITFGAQIGLESFTSGDQIDSNFGYAEGSFGRLEFGSQNSAAYQMQYGAPFVGVPINSGWVTSFVPPSFGLFTTGLSSVAPPGSGFLTPLLSTYIDFGDDENLISYYTPRISGFQLGLSYAPTVTFSGDGKNFPVAADQDTEYSNGFSVGLNFVESFNGVDVALAGGYQRADAPNVSLPWVEDYQAIHFGLNLGYAGFTVGGSYANVLDGFRYGTFLEGSTEGQSWDVGATYATGPWSFGVTYFHGEIEGSDNDFFIPGDNEMRAIQAGVGWAWGPGIDLSASVLYAEWETEWSAIGAESDREGIVGVVGVTFNF